MFPCRILDMWAGLFTRFKIAPGFQGNGLHFDAAGHGRMRSLIDGCSGISLYFLAKQLKVVKAVFRFLLFEAIEQVFQAVRYVGKYLTRHAGRCGEGSRSHVRLTGFQPGADGIF
jgi:hypothetical protein